MHDYYSTVEEGERWTFALVVRELARHGMTADELAIRLGADGLYDANEVIAWLGY